MVGEARSCREEDAAERVGVTPREHSGRGVVPPPDSRWRARPRGCRQALARTTLSGLEPRLENALSEGSYFAESALMWWEFVRRLQSWGGDGGDCMWKTQVFHFAFFKAALVSFIFELRLFIWWFILQMTTAWLKDVFCTTLKRANVHKSVWK